VLGRVEFAGARVESAADLVHLVLGQ